MIATWRLCIPILILSVCGLKREIAYLERVQRDGPDDRSKEILLQIAMDYGASRRAA